MLIVRRKEFSSLAVVIMDTTCFGRDFGVMVFKNSLDGIVLFKEYVRYETNALYFAGISEICRRGISVQGIVCNGRQGLFSGLFPFLIDSSKIALMYCLKNIECKIQPNFCPLEQNVHKLA